MPSALLSAATVLFAALHVPLAAGTSSACPPLGPVLLAPRSPGQNPTVKQATDALKTKLNNDINAKFKASAVSIAAKSLHEDGLLFNYHFTPPTLSGLGTKSIDENTMYRVGSISKLMPVLALLRHGNVSFEDPITKYIPGLKNGAGITGVRSTPWKEITVGALASHLSGLGSDSTSDLAIFTNSIWAAMGLPEAPKDTRPTCAGYPGTKACTGDDLVKYLERRPPVYLPHTSPLYSNIAYSLLGMIVEAVTKQSFKDAIRTSIFDELGMKSSSFGGYPAGFPEKGYIPNRDITWNATLGVFESSGGMFSSTKDLIALGTAILDNKLLSPVQTRRWMQPTSHTTSTGFSVGAPWEIGRATTLTLDGRTIDVYTKTGDLGAYHGVLALIPDYDLVVSVLTAGDEATQEPNTRTIVLSAVLRALIPALERAGRDEAAASGYPGVFTDAAANATLVLSVDETGPGLVMSTFSVRGFDVVGHFGDYGLGALERGAQIAVAPPKKADARLYPTNRRDTATDKGETAWRAVVDTSTAQQKKALEDQIFYPEGACNTWFGMDRAVYNYLSLGEFVFVTGKDGKVVAIKNLAFNTTMVRAGDAPALKIERDTSKSGASARGGAAAGMIGFVVALLTVAFNA